MRWRARIAAAYGGRLHAYQSSVCGLRALRADLGVLLRRSAGGLLIVALASAEVSADGYNGPNIPVGEGGLLAPVTVRRQESQTQNPDGLTGSDGINPGIVLRGELGVLPHLISSLLNTPRFLIGDYWGLDLGFGITLGVVGRFVIGAQASFEVSELIGIGARAYSMTVFDDLYVGGSYSNYLVGEVSGRYGDITARVRFNIAKASNAGASASDYGLAIRIPTKWTIAGITPWHIGLDYDRLWGTDSSGTAILHRIALGVLYQF
jgi:hypothetical protein